MKKGYHRLPTKKITYWVKIALIFDSTVTTYTAAWSWVVVPSRTC